MITTAFIVEHWVSLLFALLTAGALAYCRFLHSKIQKYKRYSEEEEAEKIDKRIDVKLLPLKGSIADFDQKFTAIKESYRYRLISLCERYLNKGYLTPEEYHGLSEMWKVYHELGGNGQAEEYYHKVEKLPVPE